MGELGFAKPTKADVEKEIAAFDKENGIGEWLLGELFNRYMRNAVESEVMEKVNILNRLYSTRLYSITSMTDQILSIESFDAALDAGSADAAESILVCNSRSTFSFASKYCSWHNHNAYPLYDRFVDECLWHYQSLDHFAENRRSSFESYEKFRQVVSSFRDHYELGSFTFKDLDKFLTRRGAEIVEARRKVVGAEDPPIS
jgi:hypothetical protein